MMGRLTAAGAAAVLAAGFMSVPVADAQPVYLPTTDSWYELIAGGPYTWGQARDAAAAQTHNGLLGHLAAITSQAETDFVKSTFLIPSPGNAFWIGGHQPANSPEPAGNWQWITGEPWVYSNWDGGEPNNNYYGGKPEDRADIYGDGPAGRIATWNDVPSYAELEGYLVEYELIPARNPVYWPVTGNWYELVEPGAPLAWTNAKTAAALRTHNGVPGHLATITFPAENAFVADTLLRSAAHPAYCIGGDQPSGGPEPDANWRWLTGEPWAYSNWGEGEPNNQGAGVDENALVIRGGASTLPLGSWNDARRSRGFNGYLVEYGDGPTFQTLMTIEIQAYIDGTDYLVVNGDTLQWHHTEHAAVGRHGWGNGNEPTIITTFRDGSVEMDNVEWIPTWPEDPPAPIAYEAWSSIFEGLTTSLPEMDLMVVGLTAVDARERLTLEQYPTVENDHTLIIKFSDNAGFGAVWYTARITIGVIPEPATLALLASGALLLIRRRKR